MENVELNSLENLSRVRQQYVYSPLRALHELLNIPGAAKSLASENFDLDVHNDLYAAIMGDQKTTGSVRAMEAVISSCMGHPTSKNTLRALRGEGFEINIA